MKTKLKSILAILLVLSTLLSFVACEDVSSNPENSKSEPTNGDSLESPSEDSDSVIQTELTKDEILAKYPPITDAEYEELMNYLIGKNEMYTNGLSQLAFIDYGNDSVQINFVPKSGGGTSYHKFVSKDILNEIFIVAGDAVTEKNLSVMPENSKRYILKLNEDTLSDNDLLVILKILHSCIKQLNSGTTAPPELTEEEKEVLSKYPSITDAEYEELMNYLIGKNEMYANGIDQLQIDYFTEEFFHFSEGEVVIHLCPNMATNGTASLYSIHTNITALQEISTIAGDSIIESFQPAYPDFVKSYKLELNEDTLPKEKLLIIYKILYDLEFNPNPSLTE